MERKLSINRLNANAASLFYKITGLQSAAVCVKQKVRKINTQVNHSYLSILRKCLYFGTSHLCENRHSKSKPNFMTAETNMLPAGFKNGFGLKSC